MYEVGTAVPLNAFHVMPDMPPPENELHAHDYRVDVLIEREAVGHEGMVCDLDVLDAALRDATARIEGRDLDEIRPDNAKAVTVEVLARWFHGELCRALGLTDGWLRVRVWESAEAFGGYRDRLDAEGQPHHAG
jgi:6-pyruvoyltetrahydropterin/6-carboxytetrahydropterin synthase